MKTPIIISLFLLVQNVFTAKILGVFPTPSVSHQVVFRALMKDLAAKGHELIIMTPDPFPIDNPNVTQIDWHSSYKVFQKGLNFVEFKNSGTDETDFKNFFFPALMDCIETQLNHPEVKKLISERHKHKFDLMIYEGLLNYAMLGFAEIFDVPVIQMTSLDDSNMNHDWMGNPVNRVLYPDIIFAFQEERLTFFERWKVLKHILKAFNFKNEMESKVNSMIKKHFPIENPDMTKMRHRVQLLMTNTVPALGYLRPLLPNTIQLGFMHIEPPKPLPEGELKQFLDNSRYGVIFMSLGSNVQSADLGSEVQNMFLKVFRNLKYDVLWKFESDRLENKPKNLMVQRWLPQADLLAHPNVKLFITHGGQQSMEETIDRGVPTVVIPFLGDQDANARRMERRKIGKHLELHTITEEKLKSAIMEMLKPEYKENIQKLRELIYDQPMTSRERAVWWTEYVIRHKGAKHLTFEKRNVPFYEKYFLDFLLIGLLFSYFTVKVLKHCFLLIFSKSFKSKIE